MMTREEWEKLGAITLEQLQSQFPAAKVPPKPPGSAAGRSISSPEAMDRWLAQHGLDVKRSESWQGGRKWVLRRCPWKPDHEDSATYVVQFPDGRVAAGCHHHGCVGKGWRDLLALVQPSAASEGSAVTSVAVSKASSAWEEPLTLGRVQPEPFPLAILPAGLAEFVGEVAESRQTPADLPGMLLLTVLGALGSRRFCVEVSPGYREPLNLYVAVVMEPGSRKSSVFRVITEPLRVLERELQQRWAPKAALLREKRLTEETRLKHLREQAAKECEPQKRQRLIEEVGELSEGLVDPPAQPRLLVDDVTPEKLVGLLAEQNGRLALMSAEGGVFGMMAGRYNREGGPNLDVYLKGHAGDPLRVDRVGRPAETVADPALTVGLTVQPDVIRTLAAQPSFRGRGLTARFLFSLPESLVGRRKYDARPANEEVYEHYGQLLEALGQWTMAGEETHPLTLSPEALLVWKAWAQEVEEEQQEGAALSTLKDWASKLAGACARIAGGLHLALQVNEPQRSLEISGETMAAACLLGRYLRSHALAAFCLMGVDPIQVTAERILAWLANSGVKEFSLRDCYRALHGVRGETVEALKLLEAMGWVRPLPRPEAPGRRQSPRWEVHPNVKTA